MSLERLQADIANSAEVLRTTQRSIRKERRKRRMGRVLISGAALISFGCLIGECSADAQRGSRISAIEEATSDIDAVEGFLRSPSVLQLDLSKIDPTVTLTHIDTHHSKAPADALHVLNHNNKGQPALIIEQTIEELNGSVRSPEETLALLEDVKVDLRATFTEDPPPRSEPHRVLGGLISAFSAIATGVYLKAQRVYGGIIKASNLEHLEGTLTQLTERNAQLEERLRKEETFVQQPGILNEEDNSRQAEVDALEELWNRDS